jgi:hypothetical protein
MPYDLVDLDYETRALMLSELDADVSAGNVYESAVLDSSRRAEYIASQRRAFESGDPDTLANDLAAHGLFLERQANGSSVNVPAAATRLAGGQFGAYYVRAVALRAIEGGQNLEIYRARPSSNPRPGSEAKIGQRLDPAVLLADLQDNSSSPGNFAVLPEVNSGLLVRLSN